MAVQAKLGMEATMNVLIMLLSSLIWLGEMLTDHLYGRGSWGRCREVEG